MLKRYWLIVSADDKLGPRNFGVTALTIDQAKSLLKTTLTNIAWQHISKEVIDKAEVIEDIDVSTLDEDHVLPNIGVVSRPGIWFPNGSS